MLDLPYDFDSLAAAGRMSGSSAIIVMDDTTRHGRGAGQHLRILRARKLRPMHALPRRFALDEQGAASPRRTATAARSDADYLVNIADNIPGGRTICAFGEACAWPVQSFVAKFKDEFVAKGAADEARRAKEVAAPDEPKQLAEAHH